MHKWRNTSEIDPADWTCGYCGNQVGGRIGYQRPGTFPEKIIYICPRCANPTAFINDEFESVKQIPAPVSGNVVRSLPVTVGSLYEKVRRCVQYGAHTSAVLSMRKLLMHVAVTQGAEPGNSFVGYVEYLSDNGWVPPNGKVWVDAIRKLGNEANHEIALMSVEDAEQLLDFCEMLLKFVYEFPAKFKN